VQVTIDSNDSLEHALRVVGSLYGVQLTVAATAAENVSEETAPAPRRAARKSPAGARARRRSRRPSEDETPAADLAAVRTWARENGFQVSDRGRVSNAVLEAYRQSTSS
jgi:hypothetical protein